MGETEVLANYVAKAKYEDLPADVVNHTKKSVIDTIACGLEGRKSLDGDILIDIMKGMGSNAEATVIGDKTRIPFTTFPFSERMY
jgi:2-methylcitrate dehydratase PrpD